MVITLLADANVEGHVKRLVARMHAAYWHELADYLQVQVLAFADVGLLLEDTDAVVWNLCQRRQLFLLTNNRNDDGPDSLEASIRNATTASMLPVFTFSDADRLLRDSEYAERVLESLLDYLLRADTLTGVGRIYLP